MDQHYDVTVNKPLHEDLMEITRQRASSLGDTLLTAVKLYVIVRRMVRDEGLAFGVIDASQRHLLKQEFRGL